MGKIVSPKYLIGISLLCVESNAAELLAAAAGSAASSTVMGYVTEQAASVTSLMEDPKTFGNEYNEAVCGLKSDAMRNYINNALGEFDLHAKQTSSVFQGQPFSGESTANVFFEFVKKAELIIQKHRIALLSIDFIRFCKSKIFEQIDGLEKTLDVHYKPRHFYKADAQDFEEARKRRVNIAVNTLTIWKNNLLAALHAKYPYKCEGGAADRSARWLDRQHDRAKEWRLIPHWLWRNVAVPHMDLQVIIPFSDTENDLEAQVLRGIYPLYNATLSFLTENLENQVGEGSPEYLKKIMEEYASIDSRFEPSPIHHNKSELLEAYRQYLESREPE